VSQVSVVAPTKMLSKLPEVPSDVNTPLAILMPVPNVVQVTTSFTLTLSIEKAPPVLEVAGTKFNLSNELVIL